MPAIHFASPASPVRQIRECVLPSGLLFLTAGVARHGPSARTAPLEESARPAGSRPGPHLDGWRDCHGLRRWTSYPAKTVPALRWSRADGVLARSPPRPGATRAAASVRPRERHGHRRALRPQSPRAVRSAIPRALRRESVGDIAAAPKRPCRQRTVATAVVRGSRAARDRSVAVRPDRA